MSRDDLIALFLKGSESDSVNLRFDDLEVRFDLFENVSRFYCMDVLIASHDLTTGILNCRPFSVRLSSDYKYSCNQIDDFSHCVEVLDDIFSNHLTNISFK